MDMTADFRRQADYLDALADSVCRHGLPDPSLAPREVVARRLRAAADCLRTHPSALCACSGGLRPCSHGNAHD